MSNLPEDDTSTGAITQGGRRRSPGGAIWFGLLVCVLAVLLLVLWASTHQRAPAEDGTTTLSSSGSGTAARTPAVTAAGTMGSATGADELTGAAASSTGAATPARRPATASGAPSQSRP